ncbi:MAG: hypothetical protein QM728_03145 [Gordonia sp. (in: high G+C Gram-positive bacteria)]|uniref:hypothetical protein n=1 Tax=Gordonia sp. (in: high G+C Gram-positive bacteria) TaxID=84139 RepID=UPI0039E66B19
MTQPPIDPGQQPPHVPGQQPGAYPPPPPPGGYAPVPGAHPFSVGDGFSWAFNKFGKNWVPLVLATLVMFIIMGIINGVFSGIAGALADTSSSVVDTDDGFSAVFSTSGFTAGSWIMTILGMIVSLIVGGYVAAAYWNGILKIADGQQVTFGSFFQPRNVGQVIIASVLSGLIMMIGFAACFLPGLVAAIFLYFTTIAVVDHNLKGPDGLSASFNVVKANFGPALLTALLAWVTVAVGLLLCGVGALAGAPIAALLVAYAWRHLTGGYVAPQTQ